MGRALLAVGAALVLCFVALGLLVFLDRQEDRVAVDNVLAEDLSRTLTLADGAPGPVVLDEVTPFEWDRVLVVERGTPRERVSEALGFEFKGDLPYDVESQELFVFTREGELVRFADYRARGTFTGLDRPIEILTPEEAVFRVRSGVITPVRDD